MKVFSKFLISFTIGLFITLISCVDKPDLINGENDRFPEQIDEVHAISGRMRIKIKQESENKIITDALTRSLGGVRLERTFPHGGKFEERMRKEGLHLWYEVYFDEEITLTRASEDLSEMEEIDIIETCYRISMPDRKIVETATAQTFRLSNPIAGTRSISFNDPMLNTQWHYRNTGLTGTDFIPGADINLFPAWEIETGKPEVIISIHDEGVDYNHEDLKANMWIKTDEDNGYTDDIHGWNFVDNSNRITPGDHGTHVAGTVAAVNNNGIGVAGVAGGNGSSHSGVRIMSCQISDGAYTDITNIERSYIYAANSGAVISQNSWGDSSGTLIDENSSLKDAINYFINHAGTDENGNVTGPMKGGIVIFATGNSGRHNPVYPAAFPGVISVGAMGPDFKIPFYSNVGVWIDMIAPGGVGEDESAVWSTIKNNQYAGMQGTSMAAPHVSGIAGLVVSKYGVEQPGLTNEKVKQIICSATHEEIYDYNPSYIIRGEKRLGSGYIDAYKALTISTNNAPIKVEGMEFPSLTLTGKAQDIDLSKYFTDPDEDKLSYEITLSDEKLAVYTISEDILSISAGTISSGTMSIYAKDPGGLKSDSYIVQITSKGSDNNNNNNNNSIAMYPNPVDKVLNIRTAQDVAAMELLFYNAKGAQIHSERLTNIVAETPSQVNVSKLTGGLYTVVIKYNGNTEKRNLIKK